MTRLILVGALAVGAVTVVVAVIPRSHGKITGTSNVETVGLAEYGLEIIGSNHPTFDALIARESADKRKATPLSVFVVNNSEQAIAACVFKSEVFLPDGQIATYLRTKISTLQTISDGGSSHLTSIVAANEAKLFLLTDSSSAQPGAGLGFSTSGGHDIYNQLSNSGRVKVTLEGVLFTNGNFVGPDTENHFEYLRGEIEGTRELYTEVGRFIDGGAEPKVIMNHLETVSKAPSSSAQKSLGEHHNYSLGRWGAKRGYAKLLLLRGKIKGYENFLEHVRTELSKPQVNLRKAE